MLTGAGVSAASGVPTFRGADGLWKNFRPETLATAEAFGRDPKLVWEWYAWRRWRIAACEPNAAHRVLADWSKRFTNFRLITQNVDGLHESAFAKAQRDRLAIGCDSPAWLDLGSELLAGLREVAADDGATRRSTFDGASADVALIAAGRSARASSGSAKRSIRPWSDRPRRPPIAMCSSPSARPLSSIRRRASSTAAKQHGAFTVEINPEATPASERRRSGPATAGRDDLARADRRAYNQESGIRNQELVDGDKCLARWRACRRHRGRPAIRLLRPEPVYSRHVPITTKIVFNREIAQIFQKKCFQCHTDGNVSVPLTTYREARPWAVAIKEEILEKRMPPWGAASGYGHFSNDMSLTGREISLILSWADGGAPSGVLLADEDKPPVFVPSLTGWEQGPPDAVVERRRRIRRSRPTHRSASSDSKSAPA